MPKLLLFAPCERVLFDPDGLVSLITVIEKLEVTIPATVQIPARTAMPMRWQTIAIWLMDQSEVGQFEQKGDLIVVEGLDEIVAAHGEPKVIEKALPGTSTGVKIISTLTAVPITDGDVLLRLSYRRIGAHEWIRVAEYPVTVVLVRT